jgi:hypothetical protein
VSVMARQKGRINVLKEEGRSENEEGIKAA